MSYLASSQVSMAMLAITGCSIEVLKDRQTQLSVAKTQQASDCFMPNKHDFCRNEQHHCPLLLWSGSDNLGAVESRLFREKNKSAHNLCILSAGRIYLWGLQATIYILVYVKDRKHKLVSGVADTAGRQEAAEGAGAGAQGQDEEINNPLIIQNSKWLQAIGKRFSNYLINC